MEAGRNLSSRGSPYETKAVANLLLDWAAAEGAPVTNLKLQKLLFFAHADHLVSTGHPLVRDEFEAWSYGPVIPAVYQEFKRFSDNPITGRAFRFDPVRQVRLIAEAQMSAEDVALLRRSCSIYMPVGAGLLSQRSHKPGGPWAVALAMFNGYSNINRRISNALILECYRPGDA